MKINDDVYGLNEIQDKVLIDLINSKPIQRLKGIQQAGITGHILKERAYTRYDHSVGVMLFLKMKGTSLEEQTAGLLHDVAHTALSHVVDFIYRSKNHDYHEKKYESFIINSEIPQILKKYKFGLERFVHENNFTLLERELPDLCADRIDYALRDLSKREDNHIKAYLKDLIVKDNEIIFSNKESAKNFGVDFLTLDKEWWGNIL